MSRSGSKYCINATIFVNPLRRDEFIHLILHDRLQSLNKSIEPDCLLFEVGEDVNDANVFYLQEQYSDKTSFEYHCKTEHFAAWNVFANSPDAFVKPPIVNFFQTL